MAGYVGGLCPHLLVGQPEAQVCFVTVVAAIEGGLGGGASRVSMNFRPTTPEEGEQVPPVPVCRAQIPSAEAQSVPVCRARIPSAEALLLSSRNLERAARHGAHDITVEANLGYK